MSRTLSQGQQRDSYFTAPESVHFSMSNPTHEDVGLTIMPGTTNNFPDIFQEFVMMGLTTE